MNMLEFLDKFTADYQVECHQPSLSVQEVIAGRHISGVQVAKPVVIRADGKHYMCVVPVYCGVDLSIVKEKLGVRYVEFVDDRDTGGLFPCCQVGAESPFGTLYGLPTLMDASLENEEYIAFQGETYDKAVFMTMAEYKRLASPRIFSFGYPDN